MSDLFDGLVRWFVGNSILALGATEASSCIIVCEVERRTDTVDARSATNRASPSRFPPLRVTSWGIRMPMVRRPRHRSKLALRWHRRTTIAARSRAWRTCRTPHLGVRRTARTQQRARGLPGQSPWRPRRRSSTTCRRPCAWRTQCNVLAIGFQSGSNHRMPSERPSE